MKVMDLKGASDFLNGLVSVDSLREMAESGLIPAAKIGPNGGRTWIFTDEGLEQHLRDEIKRQTEERRKQSGVPPPPEPKPTGPERYPSGRRRRGPPPPLASLDR